MSLLGVRLVPSAVPINAFGGELIFPPTWSVKTILSSYETIQYWVDAPAAQPGKVTFSAVYPGGLSALDAENSVPLFYVDFETNGDVLTEDSVFFENQKIYEDNPSPTLISSELLGTALVDEASLGGLSREEDKEAPILLNYSFEINPETQQKELFLNVADNSNEPVRIEIQVGPVSNREWVLLEGNETNLQDLDSVTIRLTDVNGNSRIVELNPSHAELWTLLVGAVLLVGVAIYQFFRLKQ